MRSSETGDIASPGAAATLKSPYGHRRCASVQGTDSSGRTTLSKLIITGTMHHGGVLIAKGVQHGGKRCLFQWFVTPVGGSEWQVRSQAGKLHPLHCGVADTPTSFFDQEGGIDLGCEEVFDGQVPAVKDLKLTLSHALWLWVLADCSWGTKTGPAHNTCRCWLQVSLRCSAGGGRWSPRSHEECLQQSHHSGPIPWQLSPAETEGAKPRNAIYSEAAGQREQLAGWLSCCSVDIHYHALCALCS